MPEVIDQSGGLYSLASAAGTAQGKARGTTMNGWDAATMAVQPLLANMQAERERRTKQADAERFLDETFRADPDGMMFGPAEKGYLAGLAHGGSDVKHLSQTAQALLAKRMQAEKDRALAGDRATGLAIKDRAQRAKDLAAFGGEGPNGPVEGLVPLGSRKADEAARHNAAGEALGRDRINQTGQQFNDKMDQDAAQFDRAQTDREKRTGIMANRPQGGGGETPEQTEFAQLQLDYKDAQAHTAEVRRMLKDNPGDEVLTRSLSSARTAEREIFNELRAARGRAGDSTRQAPAQRASAPAASAAVQSTKEAFRAKHGREPDPTNPADVAEMKALHAGGGR